MQTHKKREYKPESDVEKEKGKYFIVQLCLPKTKPQPIRDEN